MSRYGDINFVRRVSNGIRNNYTAEPHICRSYSFATAQFEHQPGSNGLTQSWAEGTEVLFLRQISSIEAIRAQRSSHDVGPPGRRWSQSPSTSDQFHLQASTTAFDGLDMAVRAASDQDRGENQGRA